MGCPWMWVGGPWKESQHQLTFVSGFHGITRIFPVYRFPISSSFWGSSASSRRTTPLAAWQPLSAGGWVSGRSRRRQLSLFGNAKKIQSVFFRFSLFAFFGYPPCSLWPDSFTGVFWSAGDSEAPSCLLSTTCSSSTLVEPRHLWNTCHPSTVVKHFRFGKQHTWVIEAHQFFRLLLCPVYLFKILGNTFMSLLIISIHGCIFPLPGRMPSPKCLAFHGRKDLCLASVQSHKLPSLTVLVNGFDTSPLTKLSAIGQSCWRWPSTKPNVGRRKILLPISNFQKRQHRPCLVQSSLPFRHARRW